jgi:hypothetical protein
LTAGALALGVYSIACTGSQAISLPQAAPISQTLHVSDTTLGTGGIQTWIRLTELADASGAERAAQTLFVPSDAAFKSLPASELAALLDQPDKRRAFLAASASATRVTPNELAGRRLVVQTLDGRPLVIDATGEELMVGDAEALDVRQLPDGRVVFVLDHALSKGDKGDLRDDPAED